MDNPESSPVIVSPIGPGIVYHYTDANGLLGILKDQGIRCTHIAYLNDAQEYRQAGEEVRLMLGEVAKRLEANPADRVAAHAKCAIHHLNETTKNQPRVSAMRPYFVASFSALDDDLSQWRAYSGLGPRFSIGFDAKVLHEMADAHRAEEWQFGQVNYSGAIARSQLEARFREKVNAMERRYFGEHYGGGKPLQAPDLMHQVEISLVTRDLFRETAPMSKDVGFEKEVEHRLCAGIGPAAGKVFFRPGRSFLVPFVLAKWREKSGAIVSVKVGPTPHTSEAEDSTNMLLQKHQEALGKAVVVSVTKIPYRDW